MPRNLRILKKLSKRAAKLLPELGDRREQYPATHRRNGDNYHTSLVFDWKCLERRNYEPCWMPPVSAVSTKRDGRKTWLVQPSNPLRGTVMIGEKGFDDEWYEEDAWGALCQQMHSHFMGSEISPSGDWPTFVTRTLRTPSEVLHAAEELIAKRQGSAE